MGAVEAARWPVPGRGGWYGSAFRDRSSIFKVRIENGEFSKLGSIKCSWNVRREKWEEMLTGQADRVQVRKNPLGPLTEPGIYPFSILESLRSLNLGSFVIRFVL